MILIWSSKAYTWDEANSFACKFTKGKSRQHTGEIHKVSFSLNAQLAGMHRGFKAIPNNAGAAEFPWMFSKNVKIPGRKVWLCHVRRLLQFHQLTVVTTGLLSLQLSKYETNKSWRIIKLSTVLFCLSSLSWLFLLHCNFAVKEKWHLLDFILKFCCWILYCNSKMLPDYFWN